jgi:hypothetical protein
MVNEFKRKSDIADELRGVDYEFAESAEFCEEHCDRERLKKSH